MQHPTSNIQLKNQSISITNLHLLRACLSLLPFARIDEHRPLPINASHSQLAITDVNRSDLVLFLQILQGKWRVVSPVPQFDSVVVTGAAEEQTILLIFYIRD